MRQSFHSQKHIFRRFLFAENLKQTQRLHFKRRHGPSLLLAICKNLEGFSHFGKKSLPKREPKLVQFYLKNRGKCGQKNIQVLAIFPQNRPEILKSTHSGQNFSQNCQNTYQSVPKIPKFLPQKFPFSPVVDVVVDVDDEGDDGRGEGREVHPFRAALQYGGQDLGLIPGFLAKCHNKARVPEVSVNKFV